MPSFLVDTSHCMKVLSKRIFSITNYCKAQRCGCTKVISLRLKKGWGYMIKNNRNKILDELQQASKVPLEHIFKNNDNCSAEWCFKTRAQEEGNTYNDKYEKYRCKENDN